MIKRDRTGPLPDMTHFRDGRGTDSNSRQVTLSQVVLDIKSEQERTSESQRKMQYSYVTTLDGQ